MGRGAWVLASRTYHASDCLLEAVDREDLTTSDWGVFHILNPPTRSLFKDPPPLTIFFLRGGGSVHRLPTRGGSTPPALAWDRHSQEQRLLTFKKFDLTWIASYSNNLVCFFFPLASWITKSHYGSWYNLAHACLPIQRYIATRRGNFFWSELVKASHPYLSTKATLFLFRVKGRARLLSSMTLSCTKIIFFTLTNAFDYPRPCLPSCSIQLCHILNSSQR